MSSGGAGKPSGPLQLPKSLKRKRLEKSSQGVRTDEVPLVVDGDDANITYDGNSLRFKDGKKWRLICVSCARRATIKEVKQRNAYCPNCLPSTSPGEDVEMTGPILKPSGADAEVDADQKSTGPILKPASTGTNTSRIRLVNYVPDTTAEASQAVVKRRKKVRSKGARFHPTHFAEELLPKVAQSSGNSRRDLHRLQSHASLYSMANDTPTVLVTLNAQSLKSGYESIASSHGLSLREADMLAEVQHAFSSDRRFNDDLSRYKAAQLRLCLQRELQRYDTAVGGKEKQNRSQNFKGGPRTSSGSSAPPIALAIVKASISAGAGAGSKASDPEDSKSGRPSFKKSSARPVVGSQSELRACVEALHLCRRMPAAAMADQAAASVVPVSTSPLGPICANLHRQHVVMHVKEKTSSPAANRVMEFVKEVTQRCVARPIVVLHSDKWQSQIAALRKESVAASSFDSIVKPVLDTTTAAQEAKIIVSKMELDHIISVPDLALVNAGRDFVSIMSKEARSTLANAATVVIIHDEPMHGGIMWSDICLRAVMEKANKSNGDLFGGKRMAVVVTSWPPSEQESNYWRWSEHDSVFVGGH